jgi:hypothetical protein
MESDRFVERHTVRWGKRFRGDSPPSGCISGTPNAQSDTSLRVSDVRKWIFLFFSRALSDDEGFGIDFSRALWLYF